MAASTFQKAESWTPPPAPLATPVQNLRQWPPDVETAKAVHRRRDPLDLGTWLFRLVIFGAAALITAFGSWQMYQVVSFGPRITPLQWLLLALFVINFSWIAFAFTSAVMGFFSLLTRPQPAELPVPETLRTRTVILMPIYNEAPARVFASLEAIATSLQRSGFGSHFDIMVLSDSTDPESWIAEELAFLALREKLQSIRNAPALFYRHRSSNAGRKAGNIAEFVARWGGQYDHMLVLDADSLMTAEAITGLAGLMEANPKAGIIQTLPLITNGRTLFARLQQFAARIYGPIIAEGLRLWMGKDGNYWGHNAIMRTKAFAEHCMLPDLPGAPPFGGHILSHDFVEAALMRRGGWHVIMTRGVVGSYEEAPAGIGDLARRDRRWAQGNLQHVRVIAARGFVLASRQHFATGIFSYLASPLWLLQLLVGLMITLQATYLRPEYFTREFSLYPEWPRFDAERSLWLLGGTMAILLAPKLFGLIIALLRRPTRQGSGGLLRLTVSTLVEIVLSALIAPLMMLIQSRSIYQILAGKDSGWNTQNRDDGRTPFLQHVRQHAGHTLLGIIIALSAFLLSSRLALFMAPTLIGLIFSVPLAYWSGLTSIGLQLQRWGILRTPEESRRPAIAIEAEKAFLPAAPMSQPLMALAAQPQLLDAHFTALPEIRRERGSITPDRAVAETKLTEAISQREAADWLQPAETMVVLGDRALLRLFAALPPG